MIAKIIQKYIRHPWASHIISGLGAMYYFWGANNYVRYQNTLVDEGGYLYTGLLYLKGLFQPFQYYGPPTWYAPLSQLIPGQIETWFGPGLRTGRYFSFLLGFLVLLILWNTASRLGSNPWWGTAVVWAVAASPTSTGLFGMAASQALVTALLAAILGLVLGDNRNPWQILLASFLAGIAIMTRQNMIFLAPLLLGFVLVQYGKRSFLFSLLVMAAPITLIHIVYWPNVLFLWSRWIPPSWSPWVEYFQEPRAIIFPAAPTTVNRILAIAQSIQSHYFPLVGALASLLIWPRKTDWKSKSLRNSALFLAFFFFSMLVLHAWLALFDRSQVNNCTFCISAYLSFFDISSLLLTAIVCSSWKPSRQRIPRYIVFTFLAILSGLLGFADFETFGKSILELRIPAFTRGWDIRLWFPGATIWEFISNKYHLDFTTHFWLYRMYSAAVVGLLIGLGICLGLFLIYRANKNREPFLSISYQAVLVFACLLFGYIYLPLINQQSHRGLCTVDILDHVENLGSELSTIIPPDSQVYWEVHTAVPLVYAPEISIYPSQIYGMNSFRFGLDPNRLRRVGLWNEILAQEWINSADAIVIEGAGYIQGQIDFPEGNYLEYTLEPINPCAQGMELHVYVIDR